MAMDFDQGRLHRTNSLIDQFEAVQRSAHVLIESINLGAAFQELVNITAPALAAHLVELIIDEPERWPASMTGGMTGSAENIGMPDCSAPVAGPQSSAWVSASEPFLAPDRSTWRWIAAPVLFSGLPFGCLRAARLYDAPAFTSDDEHFLTVIADQAALAFEAERWRRSEEMQRRFNYTLQETARILNYSFDLQRLLELILDQMGRVVAYDSASIMLLNGSTLQIAAYRKLNIPELGEIPTQVCEYAHIREVIERRRPVIINDTRDDHRWQSLPTSSHIRSWMGVPLIGRDQVIGLLNLDKEIPGFFTQIDSSVVSTFARQAAIAIENARLYTREHHRADQLNALTETIADISSELELPRLLQDILKRAIKLCHGHGGDLGLIDEATGNIRIVACYNLDKDYTGTIQAPGEGAMGRAIQLRKAINLAHYHDWEYASPQYLGMLDKAVLTVPFMIGQRVLGALGIGDENPDRRFTEDEERLLGLFAQHAAIAVENARLYQEARNTAERRSVLHQVSQAIVGAAMQPEEVYSAIHTAAARLMPAEAFVITRFDPSSGAANAVYLVDRGQRFSSEAYTSELGLFGRILAEDQSIYIPDVNADQENFSYSRFGNRGQRVRSVLAAAMRLRGLVVGMISAQSYQPHSYNEEDRVLLEMLASYAAIALDNTSLFQNVQRLAITDPLTGLFNRRHTFDLGQREFVRARRFSRPLSVLMMDIDHFKEVNDRYSHAIGDRVLIRLAQLMRHAIREIDIAGRYGGEEFTLTLPETGSHTALEIARRLHEQVNETFFQTSLPRITVSIGVASIERDHKDFNDLVHAADLALYAAKSAGRNQVAQHGG